jgi:hypothetical protein
MSKDENFRKSFSKVFSSYYFFLELFFYFDKQLIFIFQSNYKVLLFFFQMIAKIGPGDSQKRWADKFIDHFRDLVSYESNLTANCEKMNITRVRTDDC